MCLSFFCYYISLRLSVSVVLTLSLYRFDILIWFRFRSSHHRKRNETKRKIEQWQTNLSRYIFSLDIQYSIAQQAMVDWICWWYGILLFCRLLFVCWLNMNPAVLKWWWYLVHLLLVWPLSMSDNKRRHTNSIESICCPFRNYTRCHCSLSFWPTQLDVNCLNLYWSNKWQIVPFI